MVEPLTAQEIDDAGDEFKDLGMISLPDSVGGISPGGGDGDSPGSPPPPGPTGPDEPPAHARKRGRPVGSKNTVPKIRVTQGIRADINAKLSMPLEIGGQIWAARDQLCGGTFLQQRPRIAESLTDIICQSPALVAWMTGPVGGFMLYLDLAAALWPVIEMVAAHHVYHSVEPVPADAQQPPQPAYAA